MGVTAHRTIGRSTLLPSTSHRGTPAAGLQKAQSFMRHRAEWVEAEVDLVALAVA